MDFTNKAPDWSAKGVEPPASLKEGGFQAGYKPPAAYFNWFWTGVSACLAEIIENLANMDATKDTEKHVKYAQTAGESDKVKNAMIIRLNGGRTESTDQFTFDGSTGRTVNITPAKIGAAEKDLSNVDAATFKQLAENAGVVGGIPVADADTTDFTNYTATIESVTELYTGLIITVIPVAESFLTDSPTLNVNESGAKPIAMLGCENSGNMYMPGKGFLSYGCPVTLRYLADYEDGVWVVLGQHKQSFNMLNDIVIAEETPTIINDGKWYLIKAEV